MAKSGASDRTKVIQVPGKPFKQPPVRLPWPRNSPTDVDKHGVPIPLGVDVQAKRQDIIKLVHKFFKVKDVPMEELLQEVYVAIVHKNHTPSAHNPVKSSFGHYVYMVANNVCINLVHKAKRYDKERESLDAPHGHDDSRTLLDTIEAAPTEPEKEPVVEVMEGFESQMRRMGMWEQARYMRAVRSGASPEVVREALTWGARKVSSKTIRDIRNQVREAIEDYGVSF